MSNFVPLIRPIDLGIIAGTTKSQQKFSAFPIVASRLARLSTDTAPVLHYAVRFPMSQELRYYHLNRAGISVSQIVQLANNNWNLIFADVLPEWDINMFLRLVAVKDEQSRCRVRIAFIHANASSKHREDNIWGGEIADLGEEYRHARMHEDFTVDASAFGS